ncbi:hypothetical protein FACS189479_04690 [Spirochaetia bacterium]|nr:hypothetical protein FACS189479_04690 [Spirochaetia bacterium]
MISLPEASIFDYQTFTSCDSLSTVNLPKATNLGAGMFCDSFAVTMITLGATPPTVGEYTFWDFGSGQPLMTVTVKVPGGTGNTAYDAAWITAFRGAGFDNSGLVNNKITVTIASL